MVPSRRAASKIRGRNAGKTKANASLSAPESAMQRRRFASATNDENATNNAALYSDRASFSSMSESAFLELNVTAENTRQFAIDKRIHNITQTQTHNASMYTRRKRREVVQYY